MTDFTIPWLSKRRRYRLSDILPFEVSTVDKGANRRFFLIVKGESPMSVLDLNDRGTRDTVLQRLLPALTNLTQIVQDVRKGENCADLAPRIAQVVKDLGAEAAPAADEAAPAAPVAAAEATPAAPAVEAEPAAEPATKDAEAPAAPEAAPEAPAAAPEVPTPPDAKVEVKAEPVTTKDAGVADPVAALADILRQNGYTVTAPVTPAAEPAPTPAAGPSVEDVAKLGGEIAELRKRVEAQQAALTTAHQQIAKLREEPPVPASATAETARPAPAEAECFDLNEERRRRQSA